MKNNYNKYKFSFDKEKLYYKDKMNINRLLGFSIKYKKAVMEYIIMQINDKKAKSIYTVTEIMNELSKNKNKKYNLLPYTIKKNIIYKIICYHNFYKYKKCDNLKDFCRLTKIKIDYIPKLVWSNNSWCLDGCYIKLKLGEAWLKKYGQYYLIIPLKVYSDIELNKSVSLKYYELNGIIYIDYQSKNKLIDEIKLETKLDIRHGLLPLKRYR